MAKGKVKTMAIKLLSTAGTGFFYVSTKNPRNVTRKLSLKKVVVIVLLIFSYCCSDVLNINFQYDPVVQQHVIFNETKLK